MYKTAAFVRAYADEKENHPFRTHMERHTIFQLMTNLQGKRVLDIACGSGCYCRLFSECGAIEVVGIDNSTFMIEHAIANTPAGMPVKYFIGNGERYRHPYKFDVVFHSYFLNYASSSGSLNDMCRTISSHLNDNGFMLGIVSMLGMEPAGVIDCCDFYTSFDKQPGEGEEYQIYFRGQSESITNVNWSKNSYETFLRSAGLRNISWHTPTYTHSPRMTEENWRQLTSHPVFLAVTARK